MDHYKELLARVTPPLRDGWSPSHGQGLQMVEAIESLLAENSELRDRVWALDRATHSHDPLEGEDG